MSVEFIIFVVQSVFDFDFHNQAFILLLRDAIVLFLLISARNMHPLSRS